VRFEHCNDIFRCVGAGSGEHARRGRSGLALPWARQLVCDMAALRDRVHTAAMSLPDPCVDQLAWIAFMREKSGEWDSMVDELHFCESSCDQHPHDLCAYGVRHADVAQFTCSICVPPQRSFATGKALKSHMRAKHGVLSDMRRFANGDGLCQCCASVFSTRLRPIAHLSDARRTACRDWLLLNGTPLA